MHFKGRISAVPCLFAIVGPLLTLSNIVLMAVGSATSSFTTTLAQVGFYFLILAEVISLVGSIVAITLWYKKIYP